MAWDRAERSRRRHSVGIDDQRDRFQRDRDRILYSSAFRRLAGITQIVRAGEADVFHTREQHTIKVAQVGRRVAQYCARQNSELSSLIDLDSEVVEAACLAHDLGHPPFGHIGETELNRLVEENGDPDGFEGNAQSFRVVTKLAVRFRECAGLDLTRATLAACLKYPWFRDKLHKDRARKWGAYVLDKDDFDFARHGLGDALSVEAELMDWADDIAYSVHDLEDFHRCGAIPWATILDGSGSESLVKRAVESWHNHPPGAAGRLRDALRRLKEVLSLFHYLLSTPYEGRREQRLELRLLTSKLIGRYVIAARLQSIEGCGISLKIGDEEREEVRVLKQITRDYIISNPSLAAQQHGQRRIVNGLFECLFKDSRTGPPPYLPRRLEYLWECAQGQHQRARFAADCIASLTEAEAIGLHARLTGLSSGSVLDPIVR